MGRDSNWQAHTQLTHLLLSFFGNNMPLFLFFWCVIQVSAEGHGGVPVRIRHSVHGFTGGHIFELCCDLWVYNCTGIAIALRESRGKEPVVEEEVSTVVFKTCVSCIWLCTVSLLIYLKCIQDQDRPFSLIWAMKIMAICVCSCQ